MGGGARPGFGLGGGGLPPHMQAMGRPGMPMPGFPMGGMPGMQGRPGMPGMGPGTPGGFAGRPMPGMGLPPHMLGVPGARPMPMGGHPGGMMAARPAMGSVPPRLPPGVLPPGAGGALPPGVTRGHAQGGAGAGAGAGAGRQVRFAGGSVPMSDDGSGPSMQEVASSGHFVSQTTGAGGGAVLAAPRRQKTIVRTMLLPRIALKHAPAAPLGLDCATSSISTL